MEGYPGLYFATDGTKTRAHIDVDYSSFMSLMCVGRKRWRIMPHKEFLRVTSKGPEMAPFLKYNSSTLPDLHDIADGVASPKDVHELQYFETDLGPGELLYVPQGSPHGAVSLGHSLMVTHNHIDSSPCGVHYTQPFWKRTCEVQPNRIQNLFGDTDHHGGNLFCRHYLRFLKSQAEVGGCQSVSGKMPPLEASMDEDAKKPKGILLLKEL